MKKKIQTLEEHIGESHSKRAIYGYVRQINQYIKYKGESEAKQAVYTEIVEYIGVLRKNGMHPKTLRNHLYSIKMYYQWLVDTGQRNDHPCRDLFLKDRINKAIPVETLYTKQELEDILNTYRARLPLTRNRDKIVLSLLVHQAITVFEIIHIKISDIDLRKGTVNLPGCVKTMARKLPLKSSQIMLINDYINNTRQLLLKNNRKPTKEDTETLILSVRGNKMKPISISGMFKQPMSNGQKITPQKIRQSVIANLLKSGNDLRVIQAFTGHKRISSIEEYRQTGLEELKNAINKHHPLQ
jgi:integrase/recombinase XerD